MSNKNDNHSAKRGRDDSIREEQAFCRKAIESGAYDAISDQAWVALCERVATDARHIAEQSEERTSLNEEVVRR